MGLYHLLRKSIRGRTRRAEVADKRAAPDGEREASAP
jgi:hypothetical protein